MMIKHIKTYLPIIIIVILVIYSYAIEPRRLEVNHISINDLDLKGIKIVFASDFHIKPYQKKKLDKIVRLINNENPDLVLSSGDFVAGNFHHSALPVDDIAESLSHIKAKYGFYTSLGNHDGWYGADIVKKALTQNNIKVLENESVALKINDKTIYIAGVEDLMTGQPDINKALLNTKNPVILLTHTPDIFPQVTKNVNLILAGHTHGGQVRIPFLGAIFTASDYGEKYVMGYIEEDNKKMFVTRGIGVSILPFRFNCVPEINVIEFE